MPLHRSHVIPLLPGLFAAGLAVMLLAGCGFRPMYGTDASGVAISQQLNRIAVSIISNRDGQILRNLLIDRFYLAGEPDKPLYRLDLVLHRTLAGLNVQKDATATRQLLILSADYRLWDIAAEKYVFEGNSRSSATHSLYSSEYASIAAEEGAVRSGLNQLSETIVNRLGAFLNRRP